MVNGDAAAGMPDEDPEMQDVDPDLDHRAIAEEFLDAERRGEVTWMTHEEMLAFQVKLLAEVIGADAAAAFERSVTAVHSDAGE